MKYRKPEGLYPPGSICASSFLTDTCAFQGKLDTLCDFAQSYNQVPLLCCQPRDKVSRGTGTLPMGQGSCFLPLTLVLWDCGSKSPVQASAKRGAQDMLKWWSGASPADARYGTHALVLYCGLKYQETLI